MDSVGRIEYVEFETDHEQQPTTEIHELVLPLSTFRPQTIQALNTLNNKLVLMVITLYGTILWHYSLPSFMCHKQTTSIVIATFISTNNKVLQAAMDKFPINNYTSTFVLIHAITSMCTPIEIE